MIKTLECDRCHKEYKPYSIPDIENMIALVEVSEDDIITKDLCKECYTELVNWYNS